MENIKYYIEKLGLCRHPTENGYMSNVLYTSDRIVAVGDKMKHLADTVQFLYETGDYAPWHRMKTSDEVWTHQKGGPLIVYTFDSSSKSFSIKTLEPCGVMTIPAGTWFAAQPSDDAAFCLFSVTVCPGFSSDDCEMAPEALVIQFPDEADKKIASKFFHIN